MQAFSWGLLLVALVVSGILTGIIRRIASTHDLLDVPNSRSSHEQPTPRGGGVAIVLTTSVAVLVLAWLGRLEAGLVWALLAGGLTVGLLGLIDDRYSLPAACRLLVHLAVAVATLWLLGGVPPLRVGPYLIDVGLAGYLVGGTAIVWTLNLFNFMDGIDGIAASEAVFIAVAGALLGSENWGGSGGQLICLAFAAACCGFLVWNWPPARIFMGDSGSGYVGYLIAVFALVAARDDPAALWVWLILGGAFFADATVTLLRRLMRRESLVTPHRSHAYQGLARRWRSHRAATLLVVAIDLLWLLPLAWFAHTNPGYAVLISGVALAPLLFGALALGAGRAEHGD
ncbi:MAG: glycosyltransferase family 4 protein [Steroidobacteraceae bacterium]